MDYSKANSLQKATAYLVVWITPEGKNITCMLHARRDPSESIQQPVLVMLIIQEASTPYITNSCGENSQSYTKGQNCHDDVIKCKYFPRYWPFVRGIHRWPVNSPHKGQRCLALMYSLICFDVFFDLSKRMSKQSRRRWVETPSPSLWRHCNSGKPSHVTSPCNKYSRIWQLLPIHPCRHSSSGHSPFRSSQGSSQLQGLPHATPK